MGAAEAYQSGGPWLVLIILASAVIVYLVRKIDRLEQRDDDRTKDANALLNKSADRDQERLRRYEDQEQRNQQTGARR
jgi:hypothetical protein